MLQRLRPRSALVPLVVVLSACASAEKSLEAAQVAETAHHHDEAARLLGELLERWPESPEVPAARAALAHVKLEQGIEALLKRDVSAAQDALSKSQNLVLAKSPEGRRAADWSLLAGIPNARITSTTSILRMYEELPDDVNPELRAGVASWACEGLEPRDVSAFSDCYTVSTKPEIDYSAEHPKGKDAPDLDEVGDRFDKMERSCTLGEAYIGRLCGADALAKFKAETQPRRDEFKAGIATHSAKWKAEFAANWKKATKRLQTIAQAYESDKARNLAMLSREAGVLPVVAGVVWHESSTNKSRAAGALSDQIRELHIQYMAATTAILSSETIWATRACSDSDDLKAFAQRLWDDAASAGLHPDKSWITETVIEDCPFKGDSLR